jgi:hypothetical protein
MHDSKKQPLFDECKRIQENCLYNATSHFMSAWLTNWIHRILGSIPIVLGGIGGWRVLADPSSATPHQITVAGVMTLIAGIVGGLVAFWDLAKARLDHFAAATKYKTLENKARRAWQVFGADEDVLELRKRVEGLGVEYDQLGESSLQSGDMAFALARWKIGGNIFTNKVDEPTK